MLKPVAFAYFEPSHFHLVEVGLCVLMHSLTRPPVIDKLQLLTNQLLDYQRPVLSHQKVTHNHRPWLGLALSIFPYREVEADGYRVLVYIWEMSGKPCL
jgi:hypothetical protein